MSQPPPRARRMTTRSVTHHRRGVACRATRARPALRAFLALPLSATLARNDAAHRLPARLPQRGSLQPLGGRGRPILAVCSPSSPPPQGQRKQGKPTRPGFTGFTPRLGTAQLPFSVSKSVLAAKPTRIVRRGRGRAPGALGAQLPALPLPLGVPRAAQGPPNRCGALSH
jgi:hypothetical protein